MCERIRQREPTSVMIHGRPWLLTLSTLMMALAPSACWTDRSAVEHAPVAGPPQMGPTASLEPEARDWVERTLSHMTLRELASQTTLTWTPGNYLSVNSDEFDRVAQAMQEGVGGIWMMGGLPHARLIKLNALQRQAKVPMLVMGAGSMGRRHFAPAHDVLFLGGGTDIPPPMAYAAFDDPTAVRIAGRINGLEARSTGAHFIDDDGGANLLTDLSNVLQNRTYGDDAARAGRLSAAFIDGVHSAGILAYVGFFPGAGSMDGDPHIKLPVNRHGRDHYYRYQFAPFRHAIRAGVDVVMSSHFAVPGLTGSDTEPATFSSKVTQILREDLGFRGILITDDMSMGAITNSCDPATAAKKAFLAGNDFLLGVRPSIARAAVLELVETGKVSVERLRASVRRILEAKARLGLHETPTMSVEHVNRIVGHRDHQRAANDAADRSIVLLRDRDELVPFHPVSDLRVLCVTFERRDVEGAGDQFHAELRAHVKTLDAARVSPESGSDVFADLRRRAAAVDRIVLSVYIRPQIWVDRYVELSAEFIRFAEELVQQRKNVVLVSFGKLTVLDALPRAPTYLIAWSGQPVMQRAAARALTGRIPISGRLPVALPPHHKTGDGLDRSTVKLR